MTDLCYLSAVAEQDVEEIVTYIANENSSAAHLFLDSLFDAMNKLAEYPDIGHFREDITDKNVKFWTFRWHYLIIYKPESPVEIVRVLSGFRDIINIIS